MNNPPLSRRSLATTFLCICALLLMPGFAVAQDKLILQLKWFHQFQFAGYYAALEKGFYEEEGLNVEIRKRDPSITPVDAVLAGDAQFGISDTSLVLGRLQGKPLVVLAAIYQHSPLALISLKESGILGPLDLKNKRVMYQRNTDDATLTATFAEFGLNSDNFEHVPHNFTDDALISGRADAMSAYLTNQPFYYKTRGVDINIISPASYGIDFYGDMLFVAQEYLEDNPETVTAFRRASIKGWEYALSNPAEVVDWLNNKYNSAKTPEHLIFEAEITARMIQRDLIELGHINNNRFQRIADTYKRLGLAPESGLLKGINYQEHLNKDFISAQWLLVLKATGIVSSVLIFLFVVINRRLKTLVTLRTQELEKSQQELKKLTVTDALTGLGNRRELDEFLKKEIPRTLRYNNPLSVIIFDIDHFKSVNDNLGHDIGDQVLQDLAKLARQRIREADLVGRWGGEEFMVICPNTNSTGAERLAEILRITFETHDFTIPLPLRCSFGVAQLQANETEKELFNRADKALYQAKKTGRNKVVSASIIAPPKSGTHPSENNTQQKK